MLTLEEVGLAKEAATGSESTMVVGPCEEQKHLEIDCEGDALYRHSHLSNYCTRFHKQPQNTQNWKEKRKRKDEAQY